MHHDIRVEQMPYNKETSAPAPSLPPFYRSQSALIHACRTSKPSFLLASCLLLSSVRYTLTSHACASLRGFLLRVLIACACLTITPLCSKGISICMYMETQEHACTGAERFDDPVLDLNARPLPPQTIQRVVRKWAADNARTLGPWAYDGRKNIYAPKPLTSRHELDNEGYQQFRVEVQVPGRRSEWYMYASAPHACCWCLRGVCFMLTVHRCASWRCTQCPVCSKAAFRSVLAAHTMLLLWVIASGFQKSNQ